MHFAFAPSRSPSLRRFRRYRTQRKCERSQENECPSMHAHGRGHTTIIIFLNKTNIQGKAERLRVHLQLRIARSPVQAAV